MMESCNVTVVVLGDFGRSPRMQYHAASFLKEGYKVNVVGYGGSKPINYIVSHNNCHIKHLATTPEFNKYVPVLFAYFLKVLWQIFTLFWTLVSCHKSHYLIVQTPPAIPTLAVCWLYCRIVKAKFIIDWHNYAFSIMALNHGKQHKLVSLSEVFEGFFGRKSDGNLCVTKAMKTDLMQRWNVSAVTLYDRPPENFGTISTEEKITLMKKYNELSAEFINEEEQIKSNRPGLLVSSTSWTEDEDFSILLSALQEYERSEESDLPQLVCVITGKGPLRDHYLQQVSRQLWKKVTIISLWLEAEDYPRLLASADLGVSLHTSSSGLDLPMKVVDMFGCGLPVTAMDFSCLNELVQHEKNGLVFHNSNELALQIKDWFKGFPNSTKGQYKSAIEEFQSLRWHDNWKMQALPLFCVSNKLN